MLASCGWWRATGVSAMLARRWMHGAPHQRRTPPSLHPPPPVRLPPALAAALEAATADFRPRQLRAAAAGLLADLRSRSRSVERGGVAVVESEDDDDDGLEDLLADDDGDETDGTTPWLDERRRAPPAAPPRRAARPPPPYTSPAAAAAYAAIRSPATYAATLHALTAVRAAAPGFSPASVLDFGAGAAAATAAAVAVFGTSLTSVTAVERSDAMARVGAAVVDAWRQGVNNGESETSPPPPPPLRWCRRLPPPGVGVTYDLVLAAYSVGESDGGVDGARDTIRSLWRHVAPRGLLVVVEPATPTGGAVVAATRTLTLASRAPAHVVAPCMQDGGCPLPHGRVCRAGQRSLRPRLAAAVTPGPGRGPPPHQDERFSYVAVCKAEREAGGEKGGGTPRSRLVGPPRRRARHVLLATCTADGELATVTVTKGGGGGGLYRAARKAGWGSVWPPQEGEAGASSPSDHSDTDEPESSVGTSSSSDSDSSSEG